MVDRERAIQFSPVIRSQLDKTRKATILSICGTTDHVGEAFCVLRSWLDTQVLKVHSHFLSCMETKTQAPIRVLLQELSIIARELEIEKL